MSKDKNNSDVIFEQNFSLKAQNGDDWEQKEFLSILKSDSAVNKKEDDSDK